MAEVLRLLRTRGIHTAEILRSEIDVSGHDIVLTPGKVTRHMQMKSSDVPRGSFKRFHTLEGLLGEDASSVTGAKQGGAQQTA